MVSIHIKNVDMENIEDLIMLCIPDNKENDPLLIEGMKTKKKWASKILEKYGSCAKIAYVEAIPVGMIQFVPIPDEEIVVIQCIFIPKNQYQKRGVATALLAALLEDMETRKPPFNHTLPLALVAHAFETPGMYPQHEFFLKKGFKKVKDDPYLLYYPFSKEFRPEKKDYIPQEEDKGKALIFYDPSCPFCVLFCEKIKESLREITNIPIEKINVAEDSEEVKKRGAVPFCVVNKKPIKSFYTDKEKFQREVMEVLQ